MARRKKKAKPLATIWEVNDELWTIIQTILNERDPPANSIFSPSVISGGCTASTVNGPVTRRRLLSS